MRKDNPLFTVWRTVKQQIGVFMRTDGMLQEWEQCSPDTPGAPKRWRRRTGPIKDSERLETKRGKQTKKYQSHIEERLARYRKACDNLVVIENGGKALDNLLF
jgi:hypothetical protein